MLRLFKEKPGLEVIVYDDCSMHLVDAEKKVQLSPIFKFTYDGIILYDIGVKQLGAAGYEVPECFGEDGKLKVIS